MSKNPVPLKIRTWLVLSIIIGVGVPAVWAGQGWYLFAPPLVKVSDDKYFYDSKKPLKQWNQNRAYDTAEQCQSDKAHSIEYLAKQIASSQSKEMKEIHRNALDAANDSLCIASDDPRLK